MLDTVFGLPTHTILVHASVVLVPVAALAAIAVALYPRWRARFAGWLVLVNAATVVLTWITREAGKKLFERLDRLGGAEVAEHHRALGLRLIWFVLVLFALSVLTWLVSRRRDTSPASAAVALLMAVTAAVVVYEVIRVGHSGTEAVWRDFVKNT